MPWKEHLAMDIREQFVLRARAPGSNVAELCAATFVRYKGAEAGELDWRPTETIPEDFCAV